MTANDLILSSSSTPSSMASSLGSTNVLEASFEKMKPAMQKLTEEQVIPVTLDVWGSVTMVLGLQHRLDTQREAAAAAVPQCDASCFDRLGDCTRALAYAQINAVAPTPVARVDLVALGATGTAMRDKLSGDISYLIGYKLIDPTRLEPIKNIKGYKNVAADLLVLVKIVRDSWSVIAGKTLITLDEVAQAHALALQLLETVGERDQSASGKEAGLMRQRAFSLFVQTYDEVRRIVTFLRWNEGDADDLCPSLYSGRVTKKRADKNETTATTPATKDASHDTTPVAGAPGAGSTAAPVAGGLKVPGGNPFIS